MAEAEARPELHPQPPPATEEEGAAQALEGVAALQNRVGEEAGAEAATPRRASWRSLAAARMESRTSSALGFARPRTEEAHPSPGGSRSDALPCRASGSRARAALASAVPPPPLLIMDLGWRVHAPKIVLWLVGETFIALLLAQVIDIHVDLGDKDSTVAACVQLLRYCNGSKSAAVFVSFMVALMAVYLSMYFFFLFRCWGHLSARAVSEMRTVRVLYYMQAWRVAEVFVALVVAVIITLSIRFNSCWSYVLTWLGTIPMQVAGSGLVVVLTLTFLPQRPGGPDAMLSERLQEWSWTERHARLLKLWRDAHLPVAQRAEPLFCLETAVKLLYWSNLVYDIEEPRVKSLASLDEALDLYGLTRSELLWDRATDTKAILAWDVPAQKLLLAFAGTATLANVRTDLRMGQAVHVPRRQESTALIGTRARVSRVVKVHRGFYAAYAAGGYSQKLLWRVRQILDEMEAWRSKSGGEKERDAGLDDHAEQTDDHLEQRDRDGSSTPSPPSSSSTPSSRRHAPPLVLVTGHSLGGALATLAAHDVRLLLQHPRVRVYTFGAPRAGNRAFVAEHGRLVPDHFALICAQDPVPRVPKGWSYKRCGLTVLIDLKGSLLVRPSYVETSIWNRGAGYPPDHFLEQYRFAVQRFLKTQFTHLGVTGGASGVADLAEGLDLNAALLAVNCDLEALRNEELVPLTREEAARRTGDGVAKRIIGWCGGGDDGVGDRLLVATATRKRKLFEFRTLGEAEECAPRKEPPLQLREDGAAHT
ncbi:hypothetical protein H632_c983p1 [Helicosporidium sp. ATCC 50920]|nr:hypothetical protein H632_c983p1 [Helicosporidium sp. ATCC 50920]|eukprot:KDD74927.1 hypothetical protein H632_c983p1 [Helicosporidium sp. ATCC 50920]